VLHWCTLAALALLLLLLLLLFLLLLLLLHWCTLATLTMLLLLLQLLPRNGCTSSACSCCSAPCARNLLQCSRVHWCQEQQRDIRHKQASL
jgi:hypothetical protein